MLIRVSMGDSPVSVNYGYEASAPPEYVQRLINPSLWPDLLMRIGLTFGLLWIGLFWLKREYRWIGLVYVGLTILAAVLLSSRITRVLGIDYVVALTGVCVYVDAKRRAG